MKLIQIRPSELNGIKVELLEKQSWICPICGIDLKTLESRDLCVDHEHFGDKLIRSVLCRRCNSIEGKVYNSYIRSTLKGRRSKIDYLNMLKGLAKYPLLKSTTYIHPSVVRKKRKKKKVTKKKNKIKR